MNSIDFTVVIPAFNEERRLPKAVAAITAYLESKCFSFEIIIVNDGSTDNTASVVEQLAKRNSSIQQIILNPNQGKGGAVLAGVLAAKGQLVLFTDADQSTPIEELELLLQAIQRDYFDMAIGSRTIAGANVEKSQVWYREFAAKLFGWASRWLCIRGFADTQCGFKCMKGSVAQAVFPEVTSRTAIFDIEMLIVATRKGFRIAELPVKWTHDPDTRIPYNFRRAIRIWAELFRIRRVQRVFFPLRGITTPVKTAVK